MSRASDPWLLVHSGGPIDAGRLFAAVTSEPVLQSTDTRTRLLVRDSLLGVRAFWGSKAFDDHLASLPNRSMVLAAIDALPAEEGFFTIRERLMNAINPDVLNQMFRELGTCVTEETLMTIGGSMAMMIDAVLSRHTDDVDVVNEIPASVRGEHALLAALATRYGLKLTHFQSHYLPDGWQTRTRSLGQFGRLSVRAVDTLDVLTGKLFRRREKDLDDVRLAWGKVDQNVFRQRIAGTTAAFRRDPGLKTAAEKNWYIVTGENSLP